MTEQIESRSDTRPAPVVIKPTSKHSHTSILLHGLGNNGDKFGHELLEAGISSDGKGLSDIFPGAKFVVPTAKWRRSSAFKRTKLTQWFDIYCLEDPSKRNEVQLEGFAESSAYIRSIIEEEVKLVPYKNIILGGLSQGCAMSLLMLLSSDNHFGAYIGMSGWLPFSSDIDELLSHGSLPDENVFFGEGDEVVALNPSMHALNIARDLLDSDQITANLSREQTCLATPVFLGRGAKDAKVGCKLGKEAAQTLASLSMDVTWKCYPELGHWYKIPDEIDDILAFLKEKLGIGETLT